MPNVPNVPGVPPLSSYSIQLPALLTSDAVSILSGAPAQWGLYLGGSPVVTADTVTSFGYKQEWVIADYPIEQGAFRSYDKVQTPFQVRIRFIAGGTEAARQALLDSIAAIAGTLTLFDAMTPEAIYQNVNVDHYDYSRTSTNGLGIMIVDVWVEEVRITAQQVGTSISPNSPSVPTLTNTQTPSGSSAISGGNVQTLTPSTLQGNAASKAGAATALP